MQFRPPSPSTLSHTHTWGGVGAVCVCSVVIAQGDNTRGHDRFFFFLLAKTTITFSVSQHFYVFLLLLIVFSPQPLCQTPSHFLFFLYNIFKHWPLTRPTPPYSLSLSTPFHFSKLRHAYLWWSEECRDSSKVKTRERAGRESRHSEHTGWAANSRRWTLTVTSRMLNPPGRQILLRNHELSWEWNVLAAASSFTFVNRIYDSISCQGLNESTLILTLWQRQKMN